MPEDELTPARIVAELDKYIVGQNDAKRAVAVAVRNRWRRRQLPADMAQDVIPRNILMIGPTGVGKTEIARRLAALVQAPFIKVEATKYTEVGYVGRDVESMIRDLLEVAIRMISDEQKQAMQEKARQQAQDRLVDLLLPLDTPATDAEARERQQRSRAKIKAQLEAGEFENKTVDVPVEQRAAPPGMMGVIGMDQMDSPGGLSEMFEKFMPGRTVKRNMKVSDARDVLAAQEAEKLVDREAVARLAIERTEHSGMVFLDELDKVAGNAEGRSGPDISRQGVQRDLLPIVEGSAVNTRHGIVHTDHILFIAAGAFHSAKPSDLMPELQGRFPIRVELSDLTREDFVRILREPKHSLLKQHIALLAAEKLDLSFTDDAIDALAGFAFNVNRTTQNIGARRLSTILEKLLEDISFDAPALNGQRRVISAAEVNEKLARVAADEDLSRYVL